MGTTMGIGARVRRLFGPLEGPVASLYRSIFVDIGQLGSTIHNWVPQATKILEIGCGEGALCERLIHEYPSAHVTGIDITPSVGRLFRKDRSRVHFANATAGDWAARHPASFDMVLMCDVLHHVPWDQHVSLLGDAASLLKPGGSFVLKDWCPEPNMINRLAEFSDRVLTGDDVRYGSPDYFHQLLEKVFGGESVRKQTQIRPWPNNVAFLVEPTAITLAPNSTQLVEPLLQPIVS